MRFNIDENQPSTQPAITIENLIDNLNKISILQQEMKAKVQREFEIATEAVFTLVPQIKSINWLQYSPYFNDGDECVFNIRAVSFLSFISENADYEHDSIDSEDIIFAEYNSANLDKLLPEQLKVLQVVNDFIYANTDLMHDLYDNHVSVQITQEDTIVNEYDHD